MVRKPMTYQALPVSVLQGAFLSSPICTKSLVLSACAFQGYYWPVANLIDVHVTSWILLLGATGVLRKKGHQGPLFLWNDIVPDPHVDCSEVRTPDSS